jgi:hypothetical protein
MRKIGFLFLGDRRRLVGTAAHELGHVVKTCPEHDAVDQNEKNDRR